MLLIAQNDGRRRLRAPGGMLLLLVIPLVLCGLIGAVFSPGKSLLPRVPLVVADEDGGIASRFVLRAFSAPGAGGMFQVRRAGRDEGLRAIEAGGAAALLVVPAGFSQRLLSGRPAELELVKNPAQRYLPEIAAEFARGIAVGLSAMLAVFQDEIRALWARFGPAGATLAAADLLPLLQNSRVKAEAVGRVVSPLLVSLETQVVKQPGRRGSLSVFAYLFPGLAVLFLFFIVQTAMEDLLREKETGTLRRLLCSPLPESDYVLGKIGGACLIGFAAYLLMALAGRALYRLPFGHIGGHLLLALAAVFFAAALFGLVFSLAAGRRQASALTTPLILVFGVTGGSMLPVDQLGRGFAAVARMTPNYWFISGSHRAYEGGFPLAAVLVLGGAGLALFAAALLLLRRRLTAS